MYDCKDKITVDQVSAIPKVTEGLKNSREADGDLMYIIYREFSQYQICECWDTLGSTHFYFCGSPWYWGGNYYDFQCEDC